MYIHVYLGNVQKIKRKKNAFINFNANNPREMKFVSINMDYFLLQFDVLKCIVGVRLRGGSLLNFDFFNVNTQI